jgi:hypothetical protein
VSSDSRWTGGLANREWQSGTRPQPQVDTDYITAQVRRYLRDCRKHRAILSPYHPTEAGLLRVVFCHGDGEKQAALTAYRQLAEAERRAEAHATT